MCTTNVVALSIKFLFNLQRWLCSALQQLLWNIADTIFFFWCHLKVREVGRLEMEYMVPETLISGFGIQMDQRFFSSFPPKIFAIGIWLLFNVTLIKQIKNHQILAHWWRPSFFSVWSYPQKLAFWVPDAMETIYILCCHKLTETKTSRLFLKWVG